MQTPVVGCCMRVWLPHLASVSTNTCVCRNGSTAEWDVYLISWTRPFEILPDYVEADTVYQPHQPLK